MKIFTGILLALPILLSAGALRITDSSRGGSSALRQAALEYSLAGKGDVRIDRMAADTAERLLPQGQVDIAVFEESDVPENIKKLPSLFLGREVLVIYVNSANPVSGLSKSNLREIFAGKRPRWSEYGGNARSIHRINLKSTADFSGLDQDILDASAAGEVAGVERVSDIIRLVSADSDAMGFGHIGRLNGSVRILAVDGALPGVENVKSKRYPLVRSYRLFVVKPSGAADDFVNTLKKSVKELVKKDMWLAD